MVLASSSACSNSLKNSLSIWDNISFGPRVFPSRHSSESGLPCFLLVLLLYLEVSWFGLPSMADAACVWHICSACFQIARITSWIENASRCFPASIFYIFLREERDVEQSKGWVSLIYNTNKNLTFRQLWPLCITRKAAGQDTPRVNEKDRFQSFSFPTKGKDPHNAYWRNN